MTRSSTTTDWPRLMFDASQLWAEVGMVVSLRFWRMMAGGPAVARREAGRMVSEKIETGSELLGALAGGQAKSPAVATRRALSIYGKRVRGNRRRLS